MDHTFALVFTSVIVELTVSHARLEESTVGTVTRLLERGVSPRDRVVLLAFVAKARLEWPDRAHRLELLMRADADAPEKHRQDAVVDLPDAGS